MPKHTYEALFTPPEIKQAGFDFVYSTGRQLYIRNGSGRCALVPDYMKLYCQYNKLVWCRFVGAYRFANNYDNTTKGKYLLKYYPQLTPKCWDILRDNPFVQVSDEYELVTVHDQAVGEGRMEWRLKKN